MKVTHEFQSDNQDFPFATEQLKISRNNLKIRVNISSGQQGDTWVVYSPSLEISGYGASKQEAQETFKIEIEELGASLMNMTPVEQTKVLRALGWKKSRYFKKQFSKAYVDKDGILKDLDNVSLEPLEYA